MPVYNAFFHGEGRSQYDQNGFDTTSNLDVHSQLGTSQAQLALAVDSSTPNEPSVQATAADGTVYFFSTSTGKTWKRTTGGTYSLVNTNANGAHVNAFFSPTLNKILYATTTKLGHLVAATDTFSDSFATFTNGSSYHPMAEVNLTVEIGDGKYVASVSASLTFSANALDIPAQYSVTALKNERNWLLIGTVIGANVSQCEAFLWDTFSSSWTEQDTIYEIGVNCFIEADSFTYAQCGTEGNIYYWTGNRMPFFYQIRNVTTSHGHQKSGVLNGKPLLAIGTDIYSVYKRQGEIDIVVHEYTTTTGSVVSIGVTGTQLLVSNGSNVNKIGTNRSTATATTPRTDGAVKTVIVPYESLNGGTLSLETSVNDSGFVLESGFINDATNSRYILQRGVSYAGKINHSKSRITITPSGANSPVIQGINVVTE
ncbi:MAG: hypothetical protein WDN67_00625 [Candidatus Moraniibacteriota bacterium]